MSPRIMRIGYRIGKVGKNARFLHIQLMLNSFAAKVNEQFALYGEAKKEESYFH